MKILITGDEQYSRSKYQGETSGISHSWLQGLQRVSIELQTYKRVDLQESAVSYTPSKNLP